VIVIHLARKPFSEGTTVANVLEHGTGSLNVNGGRVRYRSDRDITPSVGQGTRGQRNPGCGANLPGHKANWGQWEATRDGRWPANLVLEHRPECRQVGTKRVLGSQLSQVIRRSRSQSNSIGAQTDGYVSGHTDADGRETVDAWECAPGCPVDALDGQSGHLHARGNLGASKGGGGMYGHGLTTNDFGGGEAGGASRFFKQVQEKR